MKTVEQAREDIVAWDGERKARRIEALIDAKIAAVRADIRQRGLGMGDLMIPATPEDTAKGGEREAIDDLIGFAITEALGERCATHDPDCLTCKAWAQYDAENRNIAEMVRQSLDKDRRIASLESTLAEKDRRIAELERRRDGVILRLRDALTEVPEESMVRQDIAWAIAALSPVQEEAGT